MASSLLHIWSDMMPSFSWQEISRYRIHCHDSWYHTRKEKKHTKKLQHILQYLWIKRCVIFNAPQLQWMLWVDAWLMQWIYWPMHWIYWPMHWNYEISQLTRGTQCILLIMNWYQWLTPNSAYAHSHSPVPTDSGVRQKTCQQRFQYQGSGKNPPLMKHIVLFFRWLILWWEHSQPEMLQFTEFRCAVFGCKAQLHGAHKLQN